MKLNKAGEPRGNRFVKATDVFEVREEPEAETFWTSTELDALEAASKRHNGSQDFFDRIESSVTLHLVAPERLDQVKTGFNIQSLKAELKSREQDMAKLFSDSGCDTYFKLLFSLYILEPSQRYTFEGSDFAATLEKTLSLHSATNTPRFIFNLGVYLTLFPEKRLQMKLDHWPELLEYVQNMGPGEYIVESLIGLRLISPQQFSEMEFSTQPAVEHLEQRIKIEKEFLRKDSSVTISDLARTICYFALLTAEEIEIVPQRGLVLKNRTAVSRTQSLPERNTV